ncbi:xanthine dehydrogenase accessory factor [Rhizobium aquaticum]|uniref:Xanthine dehydrogenase accessory factor n=1 Tax=Rhizobium aquaticum TaxID=1549636 RepID=A0ABV2J335_9HYPH
MHVPMKIDDTAGSLKRAHRPYVLATVVRTVAATAAKAGAKAIILEDGSIAEGWIGGGCARGAVLKAARDAFADGQPRLVSVQPEDLLSELGVTPGEVRDGVRFARNMCPSKGTMDVFIEPVLPLPELYVLGASPVAVALADIARRFGFRTIACAPSDDQGAFAEADERIEGMLLPANAAGERYIVVSTQGRGDEAGLTAAASATGAYIAFVGSRAKAASLREKLAVRGLPQEALDRIKAPAGLDIGAVTPEEIALSIIAEMISIRRSSVRGHEAGNAASDGAKTDDRKLERAEPVPGDAVSTLQDVTPQAGRLTTRLMAPLAAIAALLFQPAASNSALAGTAERAVPDHELLLRLHSCCM